VREVIVAGIGMTPFGKFPDQTLRQLATYSTRAALEDADLSAAGVEYVFFGNAMQGLLTGQEMIRGQVALTGCGLDGVPVVNVENACASGSSAIHLGWLAVASGQAEVVVAVGAEKLTHPDKNLVFRAMGTAVDLESLDDLAASLYGEGGPPPGDRSFFMDVYADSARRYMQRSGATAEDFAQVAVKNHHHGALNERAQYRDQVTVRQVLQGRTISDPLTLLMCAPIGDGSAAVVLCSPKVAKELGVPRIRIAASALVSGRHGDTSETAVERAARSAYEKAGVDPNDVDVVELHDAAAPAELWLYEELGLCAPGEGAAFLASGAPCLGGRVPVNTSGGLLSKGHPVGATGCAQVVELAEQLRGRSGSRQVAGARVGVAENNGGYLGPDPAAACVTVLTY
jgi:acetyl-CoA acetyltransferase